MYLVLHVILFRKQAVLRCNHYTIQCLINCPTIIIYYYDRQNKKAQNQKSGKQAKSIKRNIKYHGPNETKQLTNIILHFSCCYMFASLFKLILIISYSIIYRYNSHCSQLQAFCTNGFQVLLKQQMFVQQPKQL